MEKLICLMEDLAMINSQIQKYQDYEKKIPLRKPCIQTKNHPNGTSQEST